MFVVAEATKADPLVFVQTIALLPLVVQSPLISAAVITEADPRINPVSVLPVPVPPLDTERTPVIPVVKGSPVALVSNPETGVPRAGPVKIGEVRVSPEIVVVSEPPSIEVVPMTIGNPSVFAAPSCAQALAAQV